MIYLIALADRITTEILQAEAIETVAEAPLKEAVSTVSGLGDPVAMTFFGIAVLALAGIWYLMTKKAYPLRRYRRTPVKGPFTRARDAIAGKISPFAP